MASLPHHRHPLTALRHTLAALPFLDLVPGTCEALTRALRQSDAHWGVLVGTTAERLHGAVPLPVRSRRPASVRAADPGEEVGFVAAVRQAAVGPGEAAHAHRVLGELRFALLTQCRPGDTRPAVRGCFQRFVDGLDVR